MLGYAVRTKLLDENVAKAVPNPTPKRREVQVFTMEEVEAIAVELGPTLGAAVIFAAWTGMRPEEWIALERNDVNRVARVARIRRVYTDGTLKQYGKQRGSLRTVPVPRRAADALDAMPVRIDSAILFPGRVGGFLNLSNFRVLDWKPALKAAGVPYRPPYALRHSFASWSIAAGVGLFELARIMGTSVDMLDKVYGHLLSDSLDRARHALDSFGHGVGTENPADAGNTRP